MKVSGRIVGTGPDGYPVDVDYRGTLSKLARAMADAGPLVRFLDNHGRVARLSPAGALVWALTDVAGHRLGLVGFYERHLGETMPVLPPPGTKTAQE